MRASFSELPSEYPRILFPKGKLLSAEENNNFEYVATDCNRLQDEYTNSLNHLPSHSIRAFSGQTTIINIIGIVTVTQLINSHTHRPGIHC